jgi:hypothetical protein
MRNFALERQFIIMEEEAGGVNCGVDKPKSVA